MGYKSTDTAVKELVKQGLVKPKDKTKVACVINEAFANVFKIIETAQSRIADMECSCLPYAKPNDGECDGCRAMRLIAEEVGKL